MKLGVTPKRSSLLLMPLGQLARYSFSGVLMTSFYAVLYLPLAQFAFSPIKAHCIAYALAVLVGFVLNRFWSFRGYGRQDRLISNAMRFALVSLIGMAVNSLFVWFLTGPIMQGPNWWPLVPIVLITPVVTFAFNRLWTFS